MVNKESKAYAAGSFNINQKINNMSEQKYYWISYENKRLSPLRVEDVISEHPFIKMNKMRNRNVNIGSLHSWKEISKEEHDLFTDILFNNNKPEYNL